MIDVQTNEMMKNPSFGGSRVLVAGLLVVVVRFELWLRLNR